MAAIPAPHNNTSGAMPFILLAGGMFGSSLVVSRFSLGQWEPLDFVSMRITVAVLACLAVYAFSPGRRLPRDRTFWLKTAGWGIPGTAISMALIVSSMQYQSSGLTSLLIANNPALVVILAHFLLPGERLTGRKALGVLLAFSGTAMLLLSGQSGLQGVAFDWRGPLLTLTGIFAAGGSLVYARHALSDYDMFDIATGRFATALPVAWIITLAAGGIDLASVHAGGTLALIYTGLIGTFGGMLIVAYNIKRFAATAAVQPAYIIPLVATLVGALFLGEQLTPVIFGGMVAILGGVWLINAA